MPAHAQPEPRAQKHQEQRSPESSQPCRRIPAQEEEGRQDRYQDEEPKMSYHNLREQDEKGNFIDGVGFDR